jgi:hypothetical protein
MPQNDQVSIYTQLWAEVCKDTQKIIEFVPTTVFQNINLENY